MSLGSTNNRRPRNASNSSSTSSSSTDISLAQYTQPTIATAGLSAHMFPTIPPSPTDMAANGWCGSPSPSTQQCTSSRINFAGSWLDLGSDSEDEYNAHHSGLLLRNRRKGSSLSASKDSSSSSAKNNTLSNLKELTRRSSMHFRKLTNRSGSSS
ncbi:hypothetical protein GGI22_003165 [Coemansia erecta]|nr:hypothetical protein GGI22_003165 [Coemansia erecta]